MLKINNLLSKKTKTFFKKFRKFNALNNLDKKLLQYINYNNGFYIECGANDGVDQSNTWYYEKFKNWHGILIEAHPKLFGELKKNRSKNNILVNKFLVAKNFKSLIVNISDNDLMSKFSNSNHKNFSAQPITLTEILKNNNSPKIIDLFSLDVEGYEFKVLEGIDFKNYKFKYFLIETNNFNKLNHYLVTKKYKFINKLSHHDYLFAINE
jgi:FkbM family methyltransferase